jgi:ubiquinone biosynthesis accessory factor UbiK
MRMNPDFQQRIEALAKRLAAGLPASLGALRKDLESNFQVVLQGALGRLDLATRDEFDAQSRVLQRLSAQLEELEITVRALEQRLAELEPDRSGIDSKKKQ